MRTMETFRKTVSKGSRFNQIYVPKHMENLIEVGDEVEVRLVRKQSQLHYSHGLKKLTPFKENVVKNVFSLVKEADVCFIAIVGSFLTEKIDYNDIDVVLITSKTDHRLEDEAYGKLIENINLKFHVLAIEEKKFWDLLKVCPLTRSMFSRFICNHPLVLPPEKAVDERHLRFLLMMPYDMLEIDLRGRAFFDSIRRLITIERFLRNQSLEGASINKELKRLVKEHTYNMMRSNERLEKSALEFLRGIIKTKLGTIEELMRD